MIQFIKKHWKEILCSIIASAIWAVGCQLINIPVLTKILSQTVVLPIWGLILITGTPIIITYSLCKKKRVTKEIPPDFIQITEYEMKGWKWRWEWNKDAQTHKYKMENFNPVCPNCGGTLRLSLYAPYRCPRCPFQIDFKNVPYSSMIRAEISDEIKKKYNAYNLIERQNY